MFDDPVAGDLDVHEVAQLLAPGDQQFGKGCECARITGARTELAIQARIMPVVEGQFEDLGQVEVTGQDVGFLTEGPGLDAAAGATFAGVAQ